MANLNHDQYEKKGYLTESLGQFAMYLGRPLASVSILFFWACGSKTTFQGTSNNVVISAPLTAAQGDAKPAEVPNNQVQTQENFGYFLEIADGKTILAHGLAKAKLWIVDTSTGEKLTEAKASEWNATTIGTKVPEAKGSLGEREIDFSKAAGYTKVDSTFIRMKDQLTGFASQTVFIDNQPPTATMILSKKDNGQHSATINIVDNFKLDESKNQIIACKTQVEKPFSDGGDAGGGQSLSPQCVIVLQGDALNAKGLTFDLENVEIEQQSLDPSQLKYFVSATDLVGHKTTKAAIELAGSVPFLELGLEKEPLKIVKGGESLNIRPTLLSLAGGQTTEVHKDANLWPEYVLDLDCGDGVNSNVFIDSLALDTASEGAKNCTLIARKPSQNLKSNGITFGYLVDKTPPVITGVKVKNPQGFLDSETKVAIFLNASDAYGIASQKIEYRPKGTTDWVLLVDVPVGDQSTLVKWESRPKEDFEIRVIAMDRAGNTTISEPIKWSRPFFNAAVLTTSVNCFFCHLKIDGDVAGINFPTSVHSSTGEGFLVTGKVYGTGTVPDQISKNSAGKEENYRNQSLKVFPNTKDASGVPIFPVLQEAKIEGNANGLLVNGAGRSERISRVHTGDLIVEGSSTQPFEVNGEVFIKGNLYIKGTYKGQGTIYARNIMVVNDIVSIDCINPETCPFPFTGTEAEKIAKAQNAVATKKAALYLGALNEVLVGDRDHGLDSTSKLPNPVSAFHQSLGVQASYLKFPTGTDFNCCLVHIENPTISNKVNLEVNRVDAYLYAHQIITWRSYANLLINGGFMGYKANLVSSLPYRIYHKSYKDLTPRTEILKLINPRNNHSVTQNEIRYDYRLRVGGPGFETLKEFFND